MTKPHAFDLAARRLDESGTQPIIMILLSEPQRIQHKIEECLMPLEIVTVYPGAVLPPIETREVAVVIYDRAACNAHWGAFLTARRDAATRFILIDEPASPTTLNGPPWHWRLAKGDLADICHVMRAALDSYRTRVAYERVRNLLDAVLEGSTNTISLKDVNGTYLLCNQRAASDLNVASPLEIIGHTARDIVPPSRADIIEKSDQDVILRGVREIETASEGMPNAKGKRHLLIRKQAVRDLSGAVVGVLSIGQDNTACVEAERELKAKNAVLDMVFDTMDQGFVITDENDRITLFNRRFREIFGTSETDVRLGLSIVELIRLTQHKGIFSETQADAAVEERAKFLAQPENRTLELVTESGTIIEVRDKVLPTGGTVIIFTDITTQRAAERKLREAHKMDAIGQLTGGIAHDFNNLLTVITANLGLLDIKFRDDADAGKWLRTALRASERGSRLTRRLLSFARQQHLEPKQLVVNELIQDSVEMLERTLGESIDIHHHLDPDLPAAAIDPAELQSALINLAVNARDAMPDGGTLTIQTASVAFESDVRQAGFELKRGTYVMIAISDSGCGISKENLDRVFEPFFTTKEIGKGTGLGLSMVYGFVRQSGGQINIYSEVGVGTTVRLYFQALDHPAVSATVDATAGSIDIGGTRILVVEDNEDVLESVTAILEHFACKVVVAGDGPSALEILVQRKDIDVLFTDIVMPGGMTGFELAERAREFHPNLNILYTSGYAQSALKAGERLLPGTELLHKPYERHQLGTKISNLLNRGEYAPCKMQSDAA